MSSYAETTLLQPSLVQPSLVQPSDLAEAPPTAQPQPRAESSPRWPPKGFRHFLTDTPRERFKIFGRKVTDAERPALIALMGKLAKVLDYGFPWGEPIAPATRAQDNPAIPSGYTYLLQLVAHDMVASTMSMGLSAKLASSVANARRGDALALDTLYGGGPEVCPFAYRVDADVKAARGQHPRTEFRLGLTRHERGGLDPADMRDIARCPVHHSNDAAYAGLPASEDTRAPTDPLIADQRNDAHAIISQLTVLFHDLHNRIVGALRAPGTRPDERDARARFLCARTAVAAIYRRIVRDDLLPRLVLPAVDAAFRGRGLRLTRAGGAMPLEFSHGAFRFGHAMVRESYVTNEATASTPLSMARGLEQSSMRNPMLTPVSRSWVVDWAFFFDGDEPRRNHSHRIGPKYSSPLLSETLFKPIHGDAKHFGIGFRDLMSAAFGQLWSVPALIDALRDTPELAPVLQRSHDEWRAPLARWLTATKDTVSGLTQSEIDALVADPPLPLFVLIEAATHPGARGLRLGPLGSIIVADTILGALDETTFPGESPAASLKENLRDIAGLTMSDPAALAFVPEIDSMMDLVRFMAAA